MLPVAKSTFSLLVVFSLLVTSAAPLTAYAAASLSITCDTVSISGNTWTFSGTWKAIDIAGQSPDSYNTAVFSPLGTAADTDSKDTPDTFIVTHGDINFEGEANKKDAKGTWSNQITFAANPTSVAATLYHSQVPGNETSGDAVCTFVIKPTLTLQKTVVNNNGGNALDTAWTLSASGPTSISGIEGSVAVTNAQVTAGAYTLSETGGPTGYTGSAYSCVKNGGAAVSSNSLSLANGDNAVCTVTNDDNTTNTPPTLSGVPGPLTIPELDEYTFNADAADTDVPANTLTFSLIGTVPAGASINMNSGVFTWTPSEAQGPGVYSFSVRVNDGSNNVDAPVTLTVSEVNAAPVATDDNVSTSEDAPVTISFTTLLSNDTDSDDLNPGSNVLSITGVSGFTGGTAMIVGSDVVFTPNVNFNGTAGFNYTLSDGTATDTGHVTVVVGAVNDTPTLADILDKVVNELSSFMISFDGDDEDGDTLAYSIFSGAQAGMTLNSSSGAFSWVPDEAQGGNPNTVYPMTIQVSDGTVSVQKSFSIIVNEVNEEPSASGATVSTPMNEDIDITLVATDSDIPTNNLTFTTYGTGPTNGTVTISGNVATYEPNSDFTGSDSFQFEVCDEDDACDTATINVDVSNDAPSMEEIEDQTVDEETLLTVSATATDPNSDPLTYSMAVGPTGASVESSTGVFTWTPDESQGPGSYPVTISVTDGAATDSQSFIVTVNEVNIAPVAADDTASTDEDMPVNITLPEAEDVDVPVQGLTYSLVGGPANGSASITDDVVLYTPAANFNGTDSFTYKVTDSDDAESNIATITITVDPVNDAPTITLIGSPTVAMFVGATYGELGATCTDIDSVATVSIDGSVDASTAGTYVLSYHCTDGEDESETVTRTVTVQIVPPACSNGTDDDDDDAIDMQDPGCSDPSDNDETDPSRHTLTITTNGEGNGLIVGNGIYCDTNFVATEEHPFNDCQETYMENTVVDLTVSVDEGSTFDGSWSTTLGNPGTCTGTSTSCAVTMSGNVGLNAHFGVPNNGGRKSGSRPNSSQGEVLGAATMCTWNVDTYMRKGYKNDASQVTTLQRDLLNGFMHSNLTVDGVYGPKTEAAVKAFQESKRDKILTPWGIKLPTGIFYKTTLVEAKNTICPELILPIPTDLVNWSTTQGVPPKAN